jgi:hypothetical protein
LKQQAAEKNPNQRSRALVGNGNKLIIKNPVNGNQNLRTLVENLRSRLIDFTKRPPTVAVLLLIQGISIFLWWVAGSYLGFDTYSSRMYWSADGACDPTTQGLGVHCWSDYYYLITALESGNPYSVSEPTLYPAAGLAPFMVFKLLTDVTGISWLGLAAYLFTMTALIAYSVWFATRGQSFERRVLIFSALVLLSPAVLATFDRGNSVGFLIPTLVWLFGSIQNKKSPQTVMALALLSLIKPHYGVVALAFILAGRVKVGSWALGIGATLNLLAFFVFWPREFPNNLLIWANTLFGYQDYATVTGLWPQNISFSQSIYLMFYSVDVASGGQLQSSLSFIESRQGLWGLLVLLLILALIFAFRKSLTTSQTSIIVVSAVSMTSAISYYYYVVIAIPFLLTLHNASKLNSEFTNELKQYQSQETRNRKVNFALWFASILTLVQFPVLIAQDSEYTITTAPFIGGVWIFCYLYIFAVLLRSRDKSQIPMER